MKITVGAIIVFTSLSVIQAIVIREAEDKSAIRDLLLLLLPFLLIFLRTYILDRSEAAIFYLEVSLSLLAFPVAFFLNTRQYHPQQVMVLKALFVFSTLLISITGLSAVTMKLLEHLGPGKFWPDFNSMISDQSFAYHVRTVFEEAVRIHPTHACIFLGISFLLVLDYLLKHFDFLSGNKKFLGFFLMFTLLILQVNLASRTPFIATMAASFLLFLLYLKNKMHAAYAFGIMVVLSIALIFIVPSFSLRFKEISFNNTELPTENHENSFNLRTGIYKCSMEVIADNWLTGVGPGNVQQHLNNCYNNISREVYLHKNYNTHNQFMDYWAGMGIAGPVSLLLILIYPCRRFLRKKQPLVIAVVLLFLISLLTENLLTRQNGIVPFAYFMSFFYFTGRTYRS